MAPCCPWGGRRYLAWHSRLCGVQCSSPRPAFPLVQLPAGAVLIPSSLPLHKLFLLPGPLSPLSSSPFSPSSLAVFCSFVGIQARCYSWGGLLGLPGRVRVPLLLWGMSVYAWDPLLDCSGISVGAEFGLEFLFTGSSVGWGGPQPHPCLI